MLAWVKVAVGVLVMATFSLPLLTIGKYHRLRDEPMAVLVANMSGYDLLFGALLTLVGALELALETVPAAACSALQYLVVAAAGAVKVATLSLAVDQFTAVTSPLHYYVLMERRLRWLLAAAGLVLFQLVAQGAAFHAAGAPSWGHLAAAAAAAATAAAAADDTGTDTNGSETHYGTLIDNSTGFRNISTELETAGREGGAGGAGGGATQFPGCRWEKAVSNTYILLFEAQLFSTSLATSALFLYTALVGYRQSREIRRERGCGAQASPENDRFFANFKAFQTILKLLSLSLLMDVTMPVFRMYQRWRPMPRVAGVLHVLRLGCTILEGFTYGLMNRSLRHAYRDLLGLPTRGVADTADPAGRRRGTS